MTTFKTNKGTELQIRDLRGKRYMDVAQRLVWFREERQYWSIETEMLECSDSHAIFKATIKNEEGRIISQGTKKETRSNFKDFLEKAETGAKGRALADCGYGTQFAPELDEEDRIVDAPLETTAKEARRSRTSLKTEKAVGGDVTPPRSKPPAADSPGDVKLKTGMTVKFWAEKADPATIEKTLNYIKSKNENLSREETAILQFVEGI